jgi:hypothetical protein
MLSLDEHPGIISFLVGIIVLVMGAVGLSLVVDKRLKDSSEIVRVQREIEQGVIELEGLTVLLNERSRLLADSTPKQQAGSVTSGVVLSELEALRQRSASLEMAGNELRGEVAKIEDDFSSYREEYRRKIWVGAIGEHLGNLMLRDGREYRQATITRVTEVGLEIQHADGIARIQAPDLDLKMQDRFQWNDETRQKILKDELENREDEIVEKAPKPSVRKMSLPSQNHTGADREEWKRLRRQISGWQLKVDQLISDKADAESHSTYGNQASIPGSLETWNAKAARLASELSRARGELAAAKARLAAASPDGSR